MKQPTNAQLQRAVENALADAYLDYVNNYLTVEKWAEAYGFHAGYAMLDICGDEHEKRVQRLRSIKPKFHCGDGREFVTYTSAKNHVKRVFEKTGVALAIEVI